MAFASLSSREKCPFCGSELYTRDIRRHVTDRCKQAKIECIGKNALEEFEKLRAKRKGNQNVASLFSSKQQKTGTTPATKSAAGDEVLLAESDTDDRHEPLDIGDANDNMEVDMGDNFGPLVLGPPAALDPNENMASGANVEAQGDGRLSEVMSEMKISIESVCARLGSIEDVLKTERRMELPNIALPENIEPEDERLINLRNCSSIQEVLDLLPEMGLAEEDGGDTFLFCSLCVPKESIKHENQMGQFSITKVSTCGEIDEEGNQTRLFRNLKGNVKRHILSTHHVNQWSLSKERQEKDEREKTKNEAAGMRLARTALQGFYKGRSARDFEDAVLLAVQNGQLNFQLSFSIFQFQVFLWVIFTIPKDSQLSSCSMFMKRSGSWFKSF